MDLGNHAADFRYLVRDQAGQFTNAFDAVLADAGIRAVRIPPHRPLAHAHATIFSTSRREGPGDIMASRPSAISMTRSTSPGRAST